ncbi:ABC transporter permease [Flavobacterium sp. PLA-1-15]|uniref:ABC transporter permease n=1 Tax=Flavobacterium sp. PLA-1-15 TaxID=3380533 RepID=UPI003B79F0FB
MLRNWFNIFIYQIKNNKLFTALNILGLSLGMAGLVFAILYWNDEHLYDAWNPEKEHVFATASSFDNIEFWGSSVAGLGPAFATAVPEIESYCYLNTWYNGGILEHNGKKVMADKIIDSQKTFFSFFPYEFVAGSAEKALEDMESVAISEEIAKNLFGDENALNQQILVNKKPLTVKGVYRITGKSNFEPTVVTSQIEPKLKESEAQWHNFQFGLLVKIKNPELAETVQAKMQNLYRVNKTLKDIKQMGMSLEDYLKQYGETQVLLEPLKDVRFSKTEGYPAGKGNYQFLVIMCALSVLIMILSIVNYINLATANAIKRAKEVGVRKVLGATKSNIVCQFIFETVITTFFALLFALVIVELALPFYNDFLSKSLKIYNGAFYLQLLAVFALVILFAGIFPAVYVANFEALKVLKGNFSRSKSGIWLRNGMLVLQFAIASFFIVGSYIVYEQVDHMSKKEIGFNGKEVLDVYYRNDYDHQEKDFREKIYSKYQVLKGELLKIKGVEGVSSGSFKIGGGGDDFSSGFSYNNNEIVARNMAIDFGMLKMMDIKMKEGREFSEQFSSDTIESVLVNEATLRLMKEKAPLGKTIRWGDKRLKIIGVVGDFNINGPHKEVPPMLFYHNKTINWMLQNAHSIYVKVNPEHIDSILAEMESLWKTKIDPDYPFSYGFVDKNFERSYKTYVQQRNLFSILNVVVIVIALFGLFALASYSIQRKMKEIAIRKTLGAETKTLLKELSKQYILFCVIGFLIALFPVYFLLDKWLDNFAYRIDISALPFVVGFIALLLLTLAVVLSRAYQATRVDVLRYLKYE